MKKDPPTTIIVKHQGSTLGGCFLALAVVVAFFFLFIVIVAVAERAS